MNGKGTMSRVIETIYYTRTSCAPCVLSNKGGHVHSSDEPEACTKKISSFSRILWAYYIYPMVRCMVAVEFKFFI
jgi:hypothetical protein